MWYNNYSEREVEPNEKRQERKKDDPPTTPRTFTYEVKGLCPKEWQGLHKKAKTQR